MEKRTIRVGNTQTQQRYKFESEATTLGELKREMTLMGIDFANMLFTEILSNNMLISDDSQLPTQVQYKGTTTNDLVIVLTNTQKNIASGADRKEVYARIKELSLQEDIKRHFGRNFTTVPTDQLVEFVSKADCQEHNNAVIDSAVMEFNKERQEKETTAAQHPTLVNFIYDGIKTLHSINMLNATDITVLADLTSEFAARVKESEPKLSEEDFDALMAGFGV